MRELYFKEIIFGKTDAANELNEVGNEFYLSSFLEYEKYKISEFMEGKRYYISGRKGTGKTALLKYLECKFKEDNENLVIPIRFKSNFDDVDRKTLKNASILTEEVVDPSKDISLKSYVMAWQVYLIYQVFKHSNSGDGEYSVFQENKYQTEIWKLLKMIYGEQGGNKIVPKITKGSIEVAAGSEKGIDARLALDIEFHDNKVKYEAVAKKIIELYQELRYDRTPVYVLIDELELSVKTKKMREADIELIRDLILAINKMNNVAKERNFSIVMYASIRTDVLDSMVSAGYELNKCIEDYGVTIEWYQRGGDYKDNPLLKLLEKKIQATESAQGKNISEDVWSTYFEQDINGVDVRRFLLNYSWYRPRDVVRMMVFVQNQSQKDTVKANQEMFDRSIQEYSNRMWNEISEEISLKYSVDDMKAIKKILTGIEVPFSLSYIKNRIENLGSLYEYVESFNKNYKLADFLDSLFEWGILGNSGERMVFSFLGYKEMDITKPMIIHTPLRNYFEVIGYRKK